MSNDNRLPKFAETISTGGVALICAISALTVLFRNPLAACLLGLLAIGIGIVTLRMQVEKLEKSFAVIAITLSLISIIIFMQS